MTILRTLIVSTWLSAIAAMGAAQNLTIAAASDLQAVLPQVVSRFEKQTGRSVRVTFGSSGNFFTQIQNGAPFDLFLSADIDYPKRLEAASLAEPGTLYEYATGKIVLWAPKGGTVDLQRGLRALLDSRVRHVAIANPAHAPYGRAAVAALRAAGIYENVRAKFVLGENISQAAQFVQSGNAEAGILALSLALSPAMTEAGTYVVVPPDSYPPIQQAAVVIKGSPNKDAARDFLRFLKQPDTVALMRRFGFEVPRPPLPPVRR